MLVSLSLLPKTPINLSILRRLPSNGADKGCDGVRQIGSIHVQSLWQGYRFGLTPDRIFWQGSARVRCDKMVPFRLFSSQVESDWFSGRYSRCYFAKDKEALRSLEAGASSNGDKKRDCDGASQSDDSPMKKKQNVSSDTREGQDIVFSDSEIKDNYKDATLSSQWKAFQTVIFNMKGDGLHDSAKIAAFDFDGCLANTNVRRTGANAWSLMYPNIPMKLKELYNDGYKLVIFTNESNIDRWKNKRQVAVDSKIGRLENFIKCVELPIQVFIACGISNKGQNADAYRKPSIGMWTLLKEHFNSGVAIDMHQSFYVGDAAGRAGDHSDADREFAKAIGLKFYAPEEYFDAD
ncbi:phosphoesterase isoform X2 [Carex rostrata]